MVSGFGFFKEKKNLGKWSISNENGSTGAVRVDTTSGTHKFGLEFSGDSFVLGLFFLIWDSSIQTDFHL